MEHITGERGPPFSEEAERATLGSILLEPMRVFPLCQEAGFETETFYLPQHQIIYRAMLWLARSNKPIDIKLVIDALRTHGKLDQAGGEMAVDGLIDATPTASHAEHYIEVVGHKWMLRQVIQGCREAEASVYDGADIDPRAVVADAIQRFTQMRGHVDVSETKREAWEMVMQSADDARRGIMPGLPSPWPKHTNITGGAPYGLVTLIAGRGGTRKSFLANQWATYAALDRQIPGAYFPLEDGIEVAMRRSACLVADINASYFMRGKSSADEVRLVNEAGRRLVNSPLDIIGGRGKRVDDIALATAKGVANKGWKFILVDAFKDIRGGGKDIGVGEVYRSSRLCDIASRHKVAVIVVHHIRKTVGEDDGFSSKENQFISLNDIKGRGEITDDARLVHVLQCEKYRDEELRPRLRKFQLDVQKHNHGMMGKIGLDLDEGTGKFTEKSR